MQENNTPVILAAMSQGNYRSIFDSDPFENSQLSEELLPYISSSISPAQIIVVADSDWIYQQNWVSMGFRTGGKIDEVVPNNNNYDFLLRSVDYLSGNANALAIGSKEMTNRDDTIRRRLEQITASEFAERYDELQQDFEQQKLTLNTTLQMIKNQELAASVKQYSELQEMQRNLQKKEEEMRRMEYKIKQESENAINGIVTLNVLIFPLLALLVAWILDILIHRHYARRAERLLHD